MTYDLSSSVPLQNLASKKNTRIIIELLTFLVAGRRTNNPKDSICKRTFPAEQKTCTKVT